jgi:PST family polysaccharide transporter
VQFISGIISIKFIAHFLGTEGMVFLGNFKNLNTTVRTFSTLGFDNGVTKLISEHKQNPLKINEVISTSLISRIVNTLIISAILIIFANYFSYEIIKDVRLNYIIIVLALLLPLHSVNVLLIAILNGFQKFKSLITIKIISSIFGLIISILLIWKHQLTGALIGVASIESLVLIITIILFKRTAIEIRISTKHFSKSKLKILLQFSLMTLVSALVIPSCHFFIRDQITTVISLNSAGYWEALNRISNYYLIIVSSGFSMYYLPKLASLKTDKEFKKELINYYKTLVPIFIIGVTLIYFLRDQIIHIILNDNFLPVSELFFWQILGDVFKVSALAFGYQILAKTMTKTYLFVEILYYLLYYLFTSYFITLFELKGVVMAYCLVNFINLFIMFYIFRNNILPRKD